MNEKRLIEVFDEALIILVASTGTFFIIRTMGTWREHPFIAWIVVTIIVALLSYIFRKIRYE